MSKLREEFEQWITTSPYERCVDRYPDDASKYAWPNCYIDYYVHLAWDAWQEAHSRYSKKNELPDHT